MLKTLRITFSLRMTCKINAILYLIKSLPLLRKRLPDDVFKVQWLKILATVFAVMWEIGTAFLGKLLYFLLLIALPAHFLDTASGATFLHLFLMLTIAGGLLNEYLMNHDEVASYAVLLMGMDARQYTLVNFGYAILKMVVGYLAFGLLFGLLLGAPWWGCLLIPLAAAAVKTIFGAAQIWAYQRRGYVKERNPAVIIIAGVGLMGGAYGLPYLGIAMPAWATAAIMAVLVIAGTLCLRTILTFRDYRVVHQQLRVNMEQAVSELDNAEINQSRKAISDKKGIASDRHGFEYLNDLFFKRHKKLLWKPCILMAAVFAFAVAAVIVLMEMTPEFRQLVNEHVMTLLPCMAFVMYIWNKGDQFTQALFINCDRSLLTYSFYKDPKSVLKLFVIRLRSVVKLNLLPAMVIGLGLPLVLFLSGGTDRWTDYLVLFVTVIAMSIFFSVHYLTVYYLFQPYTAGTEMKSVPYTVINALVYVVCYMLLQLKLPPIGFGLLMIGFTVVYCTAALTLVYKLAPKTFKFRT